MSLPQPHDDRLARLSDYLDGALPPAERAAFEAALAEDAELQRELADYRRLDALVKASRRELPAVDWTAFAAAARRRREADARSRHTRRLYFRLYAPLAAAAALAFVVTVALFYQERPGASSEVSSAGQPTMLVQLMRPEPPAAAEVVVSVSHTPPPNAEATVGPAPRGRTLVIAGGIAPPAPARVVVDDVDFLF